LLGCAILAFIMWFVLKKKEILLCEKIKSFKFNKTGYNRPDEESQTNIKV